MTLPASPRSRRNVLRKIFLFVALGMLAFCLVSAAAVYFSLPYGMADEIVQVLGEMIAQRLGVAGPPPVTFSPELTQKAAQLGQQADLERLMADLTWLADDARQGRKAGSPGEDEVGAWLVQRLQALGLRSFNKAGLEQYTQAFASAMPGQQAENIIGVLPGKDPAYFLLVGAHYDHLGIAEDGQIYNGADDDATGVAAVLELARVLSESGAPPQKTIVFVLFSGEEGGRRGSTALGRLLRSKGLSGRAELLNLEVLGAVPGSDAYLDVWDEASRTTPPLVSAVQSAGQTLNIPITRLGRDPGSDASRMLAYGIPSVTIDVAWAGGDNHPYDHTPADDVSAIDPQGFLRAARVAIASTWLLANAGQ